MTEHEVQPDAVTKVARNLSAIEDMTAALLTQAVHKANDRFMPGGDAMASLAIVASPEAWENVYESGERGGKDVGHVEDEDDTWEPPLQTLLFWSEQWREEHSYVLDGRPTIASEANFIRWCLNWAWDNELHWDDFAQDVHQARLRLENVLHAGRRAERSRVVCDRCDEPPRLIKVYGSDRAEDRWKCPACKHRFDQDDFDRAHAKQLRSTGAERWVPFADALSTLRTQERPERTVRQWLLDGAVDVRFTDAGVREVWWPDLWRLHLATPTRKRRSA